MKYEMVKLSDVGKIITGNTPSKKNSEYYDDGNIPFIKPNNFIRDSISNLFESDEYLSISGSEAARMVNEGTVLVTCIGTIGNVGIASKKICFNQQINAIEPDNTKINSRYLAYTILKYKKQLKAIANAPVVPIINKTQFSLFEIPLPPLETQEKIVEVLDKAQALIDARKEQIRLMDELIQAQFIEMFGDPVINPKGWKTGYIGDITEKTQYGTSKKANEIKGNYPIIRMNNITYSGGWDLRNIKYIDLNDNELDKYLVFKGDLLFNRTNSKELVGKTAIFREEVPMAFAGYLVKLRTNEKGNTEYISAYLNSIQGKSVLFNMAKSIVGMANINAEELKKIKINIPPVSLQNDFAFIVENIENQKRKLEQSLIEYELNYKVIMNSIF